MGKILHLMCFRLILSLCKDMEGAGNIGGLWEKQTVAGE